MKRRTGILVLILFIFIFPIYLYAFSCNCAVTRILDGDTFYCLPTTSITIPGVETHKDRTITVRLRGVDAPEKDQPYGIEAKEFLKELIGRKTVRLDIKDVDQYGRVVAYVFIGSLNVNLEQVRRGLAWAYIEYLDRPYASEFYEAEKEARKRELGLWKQANPTPPWEWRKTKKLKEIREKVFTNEDLEKYYRPTHKSTEKHYEPTYRREEIPYQREESSRQTRYECGKKYYCSQMESCEEAMFYYTVCGLKRLDGDNDGIPCESLCRNY